MFQHLNMFGCPSYVWMPPYVWIACILRGVLMSSIHLYTPICLDTLHMFGWPLYIHNTNKACFVRLRGCPYTPIYLDAPRCLDTPHMCSTAGSTFHSHMFGHPLYVACPPCLDTTHMFGCPAACVDAPCMFGCPHMCGTAGNTFQPAAMFRCPLYVLMSPYVWTPPICLDASCVFGCPHISGHNLEFPPFFFNFKYFIHFSKYSFEFWFKIFLWVLHCVYSGKLS